MLNAMLIYHRIEIVCNIGYTNVFLLISVLKTRWNMKNVTKQNWMTDDKFLLIAKIKMIF